MVVLVPALAHRANPGLNKTGTSDEKGHFVIRGGAARLYTVFAWEAGTSLRRHADGLRVCCFRDHRVHHHLRGCNEVDLVVSSGNSN